MGGISTDCAEADVKQFFNDRYVRVASLKVLRRNYFLSNLAKEGKPTTIGFLLCPDEESKNRALELDKVKFRDRMLTIRAS